MECLPGVCGTGIALVRSNWGVKAGDGLEKSRDYAFCPFGSPNFGALVLLTLPVYKIMALICCTVRSLECLPGVCGTGIALVSGNWGAKVVVLEKSQVREAEWANFVLAMSWRKVALAKDDPIFTYMTCEAVQAVPSTLVYLPFFKTLNLGTRGYAFHPLGSLDFGRLVLLTLPVYKIMALICCTVRSLECLPGVCGLGIASVSWNCGPKVEAWKNHKYERV